MTLSDPQRPVYREHRDSRAAGWKRLQWGDAKNCFLIRWARGLLGKPREYFSCRNFEPAAAGGRHLVDAMRKIASSSDELPAHLDERTRFALWYELYRAQYGGSDISVLPDRPFRAHTEFTMLQSVVLSQYQGTNANVSHTARHIASMRTGAVFSLVITRTPVAVTQHRRELVLRPDGIGLFTNIEPAEFHPLSQPGIENGWMTITMPTARLQELVVRAEDLIAAPIDPATGRYSVDVLPGNWLVTYQIITDTYQADLSTPLAVAG
jgi:hypothetical protein